MPQNREPDELLLNRHEPLPDELDALIEEADKPAPDKPDATETKVSGEKPALAEKTGEAAAPASGEDETSAEGEKPSGTDHAGDAKAKKKPWFMKEIDNLRASRRELERRARVAEEQLEASRSQTPTSDDAPPSLDEFEKAGKTYDDYYRALTRYEARQEFRQQSERTAKETAERAAKDAEQARAQERQAHEQSFRSRIEEAKAKFPDFEAVAFRQPIDGGPIVTETMSEDILAMELGPEVLYYLGTHQAEAAHIAQLSPRESARALGRIEALVSQPAPTPPRVTTKAPAPITPVSGNGAAPRFDPEKGSYADYAAWRSRQPS